MVHAQGETISSYRFKALTVLLILFIFESLNVYFLDTIEDNVEGAAVNVESGKDQIQMAAEYQVRSFHPILPATRFFLE